MSFPSFSLSLSLRFVQKVFLLSEKEVKVGTKVHIIIKSEFIECNLVAKNSSIPMDRAATIVDTE